MPEEENSTNNTSTNTDNTNSTSNSEIVSEALPTSTFTNSLGYTINCAVSLTDDALKLYDELLKKKEEASEDEQKEIQAKIDSIISSASKNKEAYSELMSKTESNENKSLAAWDPRLRRLDAFYMQESSDDSGNVTLTAPLIVPFSSVTAASAFKDLVFTLPAAAATQLRSAAGDWMTIDVDGYSNGLNNDLQKDSINNESSDQSGNIANQLVPSVKMTTAVLVPFNSKRYTTKSMHYGTASLMNPYSLTKLVGSLDIDGSTGTATNNYMYDIRDQRRFYGISVDADTDWLSVSDPTVSNIIKWSNADIWGRTPYSYLDFVFSKWFGIIPNNRLLTLRRYHAPVYDNLNFDGMTATLDSEEVTRYYAPRCTVVTYMGEDTGNLLSDIFKFSTGINWTDTKSDIWSVTGNDALDPQAKIDEMFDGNNGFSGAENPIFSNIVSAGNTLTGKILSFGKFALGLKKGSYGMDQATFKNLSTANMDPYSDSTFQNRIKGPLDRIDTVKRRSEGITFDQSFSIKCTYLAKSIGGINTKAVMIDILNNCLEMVSADAVFWGGGHKFMIEPLLYPFHDNGWRDSFMKRLYNGKIFGSLGALSLVLQGVKSFGADGAKDGNIWSNITSKFKEYLGEGLGAIGSVVSSIAGALFGESSGNFLNSFINQGADAIGGSGSADAGKSKLNNLFGNMNTLWHNKVMQSSLMPQINGMASLLIGEPVGEWHLTVGNPLNPIMVIGNLICTKMDVQASDSLGPDDFPDEITVTYELQHGMPRDKAAIQSMFNRGMGKSYELPDYIKSSSQYETEVDHYTGGRAFREPAFMNASKLKSMGLKANGYSGSTFQTYKVDKGTVTALSNPNADVTMITKFTPTGKDNVQSFDMSNNSSATTSNYPIIRSLAITRMYNS